ncbi:hypothetical protein M011DRAFT_460890 [Sporormia fimetaria CBS 119925]|uniref:Uncharacterized protein n=1 Tax=Sporormia fimetaria CBS 119925 TaxID=1340428 RepID=A0A6A6V2S1_9PLEO|nr:hypothetical protein M011DRAFT_460890 [Sporormia fimetaria CBS 119925]
MVTCPNESRAGSCDLGKRKSRDDQAIWSGRGLCDAKEVVSGPSGARRMSSFPHCGSGQQHEAVDATRPHQRISKMAFLLQAGRRAKARCCAFSGRPSALGRCRRASAPRGCTARRHPDAFRQSRHREKSVQQAVVLSLSRRNRNRKKPSKRNLQSLPPSPAPPDRSTSSAPNVTKQQVPEGQPPQALQAQPCAVFRALGRNSCNSHWPPRKLSLPRCEPGAADSKVTTGGAHPWLAQSCATGVTLQRENPLLARSVEASTDERLREADGELPLHPRPGGPCTQLHSLLPQLLTLLANQPSWRGQRNPDCYGPYGRPWVPLLSNRAALSVGSAGARCA